MVETLRWKRGRLELLDQTLLPERVVYRPLRTARKVAAAIRDMLVRGAPAIGVAAAFGMALAARGAAPLAPAAFVRELVRAERLLAASRPPAVNLFWALARMRRLADAPAADGRTPREAAALLEAEAVRILEEDIAINRAMGRHGAKLIARNDVVLTHCNAGALATAGYGTALGVIRAAWEAGKKICARRRDAPALPGRQTHRVGARAGRDPGDGHRGHRHRLLPAQGDGLISTFAPRPLESDPEALRVPFYHRNTDYDEVPFYNDGEFFSRSGIRQGMLTLHPQGIHHGPQPQAVQASKTKTHTSEVAVMIESKAPFTVQPEMESVEIKDYALSWSR